MRPGGKRMAWRKPEHHDPRQPPEPNLWALTGKGMELAAVVGVLAFIGWRVDLWLDSYPWFFLVLAGVGLVGGMYNLWRDVKKYL